MASLLQCPRKHYWEYEVGLRSTAESFALHFGKAWHRATEARWKGADYETALAFAVSDAQFDELGVATFSALLAGYFNHYKNESFIKTVHPEVEFSQPLAGSRTFRLAGKIDGLIETVDSRPGLKEDKTTGESIAPDSDYWLRLRFNSQLMQYILAARPMGWDVQFVIYDVVRKPSIEPRQIPARDENGKKIVVDANGARVLKAKGEPRESADAAKGYTMKVRMETPDEFAQRLYEDTLRRPDFYFARREVPIIEQDLEAFRSQRLTLAHFIQFCRREEKKTPRREDAWPRNVSADTCKFCDYAKFCLQNLSVDLNNLPAGFKLTNPNPELTPASRECAQPAAPSSVCFASVAVTEGQSNHGHGQPLPEMAMA